MKASVRAIEILVEATIHNRYQLPHGSVKRKGKGFVALHVGTLKHLSWEDRNYSRDFQKAMSQKIHTEWREYRFTILHVLRQYRPKRNQSEVL